MKKDRKFAFKYIKQLKKNLLDCFVGFTNRSNLINAVQYPQIDNLFQL